MEEFGRWIAELLKEFEGVSFNFNFGGTAVAAGTYIFMALALFAIAQNRGIKNPWLAWIPVANMWLLGCICDQYRYVVRGEQSNRRTKLMTLSIIETALAMLVCIIFIACFTALAVMTGFNSMENLSVPAILMLSLLVLIPTIAILVVAVLMQIEKCRAYYDVFVSCLGQRAKAIATWSIIASCLGVDLVAAILLFTNRIKEEGMPPRKAA